MKVAHPFKDPDFPRLLAPDADPSELAGHVSSFRTTLRCIREGAPLPYAYHVSAIPTLPTPSSASTTISPSGEIIPSWSPDLVFAPHLDAHGRGTECNPADIWNPFEGPFDFSAAALPRCATGRSSSTSLPWNSSS